jgi:hypothetical protein
MMQSVPSKLALATIADFVRDPAAYDEVQSFERAVREFGEEVVAALRALAEPQAHEQLDPHEAIARLRPGVGAATALAVLEPLL